MNFDFIHWFSNLKKNNKILKNKGSMMYFYSWNKKINPRMQKKSIKSQKPFEG